jgi:hypothetical protein
MELAVVRGLDVAAIQLLLQSSAICVDECVTHGRCLFVRSWLPGKAGGNPDTTSLGCYRHREGRL